MLLPWQLDQLQRAAASSVECERATLLPAEVTVAQWALESTWGMHQPGNNCFGITAYKGCYGVQLLNTSEVVKGMRIPMQREFATFPELAACFEKHATLLTAGRPYASAWGHYLQTHDVEALVRQIAPIYATDPNYADMLLKIIGMPQVKAALAAARLTGV